MGEVAFEFENSMTDMKIGPQRRIRLLNPAQHTSSGEQVYIAEIDQTYVVDLDGNLQQLLEGLVASFRVINRHIETSRIGQTLYLHEFNYRLLLTVCKAFVKHAEDSLHKSKLIWLESRG